MVPLPQERDVPPEVEGGAVVEDTPCAPRVDALGAGPRAAGAVPPDHGVSGPEESLAPPVVDQELVLADGALDEGVEDLVGQVREGVQARGRGVGGPEDVGEPERAAAGDGGGGPAGGGVDAPVRGGGHQGDVVDSGLAVAVLWGLAACLGAIAEPPEVLVAVAGAVERADARVRERDPRGRDLEVDLRAGVDLHAPEGVGTPALALGHQADVVDAGPGEGVRGLRAIGGGGAVDLPSVALGVARGVEELDA